MTALVILIISASNFALGYAAHWLNERDRRRFDARLSTMMRVGTDAAGRV